MNNRTFNSIFKSEIDNKVGYLNSLIIQFKKYNFSIFEQCRKAKISKSGIARILNICI